MLLRPKKLKDLFQTRVWTISNFLSLSRVLMLPAFIYFSSAYVENPADISGLLLVFSLFALAVLTDFLDGFLARYFHQQSVLGRYLDPICDKITTVSAMFMVVYYFNFPLWVLLLYLLRELIATTLGGYLYFKRGIQGKPNWWGKFGVAIVSIDIFYYMIKPYLAATGSTPQWILNLEILNYLLVFVISGGIIAYAKTYWVIIFFPEKYSPHMKYNKKGKEIFQEITD